MCSSEAYWHVSSVVNQVGQVLDQVRTFITAGDGGNALIYLEAITDEYVEGWLCLDDSDGDAGGFSGRWVRPGLKLLWSLTSRLRNENGGQTC